MQEKGKKTQIPQNIVLYQMDNSNVYVNVYYSGETFWLTQKAMAELFGCSTDNISLHLKNIFSEGELNKDSVTEKYSATADAKNYLNEKECFRQAESRGKACFHYAEARKRLNLFELSRLNRLVTMFIDYAELMAEDNIPMSMQDWLKQTDVFLNNNRREVLANKGTVSHDQAIAKATQEYEIFRVRQDQEYVSEFDKEMEKYLRGNK